MVSNQQSSNIIHLHPTLKCNLKCSHCYSSSAPHFRDVIDLELIKPFLLSAFQLGFNTIAVSGGEPFLYKDLDKVLAFTKAIGYKNTLVSNGMLLKTSLAKRSFPFIDFMAISVDGNESQHDLIRGQKGAFRKMLDGINIIKQQNIPFGFAHTVNAHNWKNIIDLDEWARKQGANLLQLHPLESIGRAKSNCQDILMDIDTLHKIYIISNLLRRESTDTYKVQLDLLHQHEIKEDPSVIKYFGENFKIKLNNFASALQSLIIDEKGDITPHVYGFNPFYKIANIKHGNFEKLLEHYIAEKGDLLYQFAKNCFKSSQNGQKKIFAWSEFMHKQSYKQMDTRLSFS